MLQRNYSAEINFEQGMSGGGKGCIGMYQTRACLSGSSESLNVRRQHLQPRRRFGLALIIVRRAAGSTGFVVQPRRWVVERTLGWLGRWRRLSKDYEELPEVSEAMATLAMIRLMLHRLARPNCKRLPAP